MSSGFDNLSLALYTTLSPAGVIAFICASIPLLFFTLKTEERAALNRYLAVPYTFVLVGFIASATHLGTPSNALHVFSGVGRSPLSNEVLCAVIFLFAAGSHWMFSFKESFPAVLSRIWLALSCIAGIVFVAMTSTAYSVDSVITWDTWFTPMNLWLSALLAGPAIGVLACACARLEAPRFFLVLVLLSLAALVVGSIILFMHNESLEDVANYLLSASELVPTYFAMIIVHCLCGGAGIVLALLSLRKGVARKHRLLLLTLACVLLTAAVLIPRAAFYELHMTPGF